MTTSEKLLLLRSKMQLKGIDAYIISDSDPHMSEYAANHWKERSFFSGFNGSAGIVVVMREEAGLWTDSRYYLQAEIQLGDSGIDLYKMGLPETPDYIDWIAQRINPGGKVAFAGDVFSVSQTRKISQKLKHYGISIDTTLHLIEEIWEDREPIPGNIVNVLDVKYAGIDRNKKIEKVREEIRKQDGSHYLITALDEIAWVLNLRGTDVSYNPVFHAYLIITLDSVYLFLDPGKINSETGHILSSNNISLNLYSEIFKWVADIPSESAIIYDPDTTNAKVYSNIPKAVIKIEKPSIVKHLKGIKNPIEQEGFRIAHRKDGVAMVKFLEWLEKNVPKGNVNELSAAVKLKEFRAENENFMGESFNAISGFAANGAIVHYSVNEESSVKLQPNNFYLIDSGGQYPEGTTDITRTVHLGTPTEQQKKDFTLVLKGHIALATVLFPTSTRGVHLDTLARQALWSEGLDYGHGTGHGVGCYLNVHEGPQTIRREDNGVDLKPGMVSSNEPGLYRTNEYGIRIEKSVTG